MFKNKKFNSTIIVFFISMFVSLIILLTVLLIGFKWSVSKESQLLANGEVGYSSNIPKQIEEYAPTSKECMTILFLGCKDITKSVDMIQLMYYDAPKNNFYNVPIPVNMKSLVKDNVKTLQNHYNYESTQGLVRAVESLFGIRINVFIRTTQDGVANLIDTLGGLELDVTDTNFHINNSIKEGTYLFNGTTLSSYLFSSMGDVSKKLNLQSDVFNIYLNKLFSQENIANREKFVKSLFYNTDTNLTRYTITIRGLAFSKLYYKDNVVTNINLKKEESRITSSVMLSKDQNLTNTVTVYDLNKEDKILIESIINKYDK